MNMYELWIDNFCERKRCDQAVARKLFPNMSFVYFPADDDSLIQENERKLDTFNSLFVGDLLSSVHLGSDWMVPYTNPSNWGGLFGEKIMATASPYELPALSLRGEHVVGADNYQSWVDAHFQTLRYILCSKPDLDATIFVISRILEPLAAGFHEFATSAIPLSFIKFPLREDYPQCLEKKPRAEFTKLLASLSHLKTRMAKVHSSGHLTYVDNGAIYAFDWTKTKQMILEKWKYTRTDLRELLVDLDLAYSSEQMYLMDIRGTDNELIAVNFCRCDEGTQEIDDLHLLKLITLPERLSDFAIVKNIQMLKELLPNPESWSYVLSDTMEPSSYPESPALRYKHKFLPKGVAPDKTRSFGVSFILHRNEAVVQANKETIKASLPKFFDLPVYEQTL